MIMGGSESELSRLRCSTMSTQDINDDLPALGSLLPVVILMQGKAYGVLAMVVVTWWYGVVHRCTGILDTWPSVDESLLPFVGCWFQTLTAGIQFYMSYARSGGFDVRHSTVKRGRNGEIVMRYLVCSRQGLRGGGRSKPTPVLGDKGGEGKQHGRRISKRVQCLAKICLRMDTSGVFVVSVFEDKHTHPLCSEASRQFMRGNRQLNATQQAFIANCIKANMGTSQTFRLCKEMVGSYENIGATRVEFHNFKRDLQAYVDGFDDPLARSNFKCFGDAISFDAMYGTNRHMFLVFKDAQLTAIPPQYVVSRWCKQPNPELSNAQCIASSTPGSSFNALWGEINTCVGMVGSNEVRMTRLVEALKELKGEFVLDGSGTNTAKGNSRAIEALYGVKPPLSISIKPPAQAKNKGSCKRFKSKRELAIEAKARGEHKYAACGLYGRHDSRNCPTFPRVPTRLQDMGDGAPERSWSVINELLLAGENTMKDAQPLAPANALRSLGGYLPLFFLYPVC
nr:protein FAR1-RELATED SEQUENCE 5-like [Ipomoea trifida]